MYKTFLFLLIIVSSRLAIAQDQEYAITTKNDTIYGKVVISSYDDQQVIVKNGKQKTTFKVYQTKSLSTKKGIYHTLKIRERYQWARLEKEGYLSYYKFSGGPNSSSASFDTPILVKKSGEQKEVPNLGFKKQLAKFLSDCENVKENFEADAYRKNDLITIIEDYNQCIKNNTSEINIRQTKTAKNVTKTDQINQIIYSINDSPNINNKVQVVEMLYDVKAKIKSGEKIPSYLIGALKEKLASDPDISKELLQIIQ